MRGSCRILCVYVKSSACNHQAMTVILPCGKLHWWCSSNYTYTKRLKKSFTTLRRRLANVRFSTQSKYLHCLSSSFARKLSFGLELFTCTHSPFFNPFGMDLLLEITPKQQNKRLCGFCFNAGMTWRCKMRSEALAKSFPSFKLRWNVMSYRITSLHFLSFSCEDWGWRVVNFNNYSLNMAYKVSLNF